MKEREVPAPAVNPETVRFWQAAQEGTFLVKRCGSCGDAHFYPRSLCPFCFSENTSWEPISGEGVVYSFSVIRQSASPYVLAYVTLREGPTVLSNIVTDQPNDLQIGDKVGLTFRPSKEGQSVPMFEPKVRSG
jgi:uncharacterized OB-fold protein